MFYQKIIGKGTYGKVFEIKQNDEYFALKKSTGIFDDITIRSFLNEMKIMKILDHPNILKCKSCYYEDNCLYYTMDLYPSNLQNLIKYNKYNNIKIKTNLINSYLIDISNGLDYLHKNNIIHCDLSDDNILIKNNKCVIADFGLSSLKLEKYEEIYKKKIYNKRLKFEQRFPVFKSPFASPEVLYEKYYDTSSDIWAFGVLIILLFSHEYIFKCLNNRMEHLIHINCFLIKSYDERIDFIKNLINRDIDDEGLYINEYDISTDYLNIILSIFHENKKLRPSAEYILSNLNNINLNNLTDFSNEKIINDENYDYLYSIEYDNVNEIEIDKKNINIYTIF